MFPHEFVAHLRSLGDEVDRLADQGFILPAALTIFAGIDAVSSIDPAINQSKISFISWCDKYLKVDENQQVQYTGQEVYGARCALMHALSQESDYHRKNPSLRLFAYYNGGVHELNESGCKPTIFISIPTFAKEFSWAMRQYLSDLLSDKERLLAISKAADGLFICHDVVQ